MFPSHAALNPADLHLTHAEINRDFALHPRVITDGSYIGLGQFDAVVLLAALLSSLGDLISVVFCLRAKKQMRGVDAQTHVALVEYADTAGNLAIRELPHDSVGASNAAVEVKTAVPGAANDSGRPEPASIGLVNSRPESIGYAFRSHVTSLGSVVRSAVGGQILIALRYFSMARGL